MAIGEAWTVYHDAIVPAHAPAVQREECKRAFYAGAAAMFTAVLVATDPDDDDACEARLQALETELEDYLRLFKTREGLG